MTGLMRLISFLFHPLLLATYLLLIFYRYLPELFSPVAASSIPKLILATFITTFIIPVLSISIMRMTSRVRSLELTNRQERILPFISITLFYLAATYVFISKLSITPPLSIMMIASTVLIFILLVITLKYKISIHAAAIWGTCGVITALSIKLTGMSLIYPVLGAFIAAGLVSSSRLYLGFHKPGEIWYGSAVGFVICFAAVYFFG